MSVVPAVAAAQLCQIPDQLRGTIPAEPPPRAPYEPLVGGTTTPGNVHLGIGHVHYSADNPVVELPPGEDNWLERVELPLSSEPGARPWGGLLRGWVGGAGLPAEPLTTRGLLETGYEEASFIVLESRSDGWLRIRYGEPGGEETAWVPLCALRESLARLDFTPWSDWFLGDRASPLFLRSAIAGDLHSEPSPRSTRITSIAGDHILEPLEIRADWMRVRLKQPSDYCSPDVVSASVDGWLQWFSEDDGPRVWYFTRGC